MKRDDVKKTVSDVAKSAKEAGAEALGQAREEVGEVASRAGSALRDAAEARAERGKDAISDQGHALADRIRGEGGDPEHSFRGRLLSVVADGVSEMSDDLRGRSLSSLVERTEGFARQHPGAFVAGAALAGFSIARFAMASASRRPEPQSLPDAQDEPAGYPAQDHAPASATQGSSGLPMRDERGHQS